MNRQKHEAIERVIGKGPFAADWESIRQAYTIPNWYQDGKFGIFIHWGVYAVPAFGNEWYARNMYQADQPEFAHHVATYGAQTQFGYKDFIPLFTAAQYDPEAWAALFQAAGAKFVVPVAEHHDGFAMYDSALTRWCASKMGPQRDLIGELAAAVRAQDLVFGLSSHRAEHWWFMNGGRTFDADVNDPAYADFYGPAMPMAGDPHKFDTRPYPDQAFLDDWLARACELVDKYQPQLFWFDWWINHEAFKPILPRFAAYYYNRAAEWDKPAAVNHKFDAFPPGTAVLDIERGQLAGIRSELWQNDTSLTKTSWGYIEGQQYKTADSLIDDLVDIVSKNGALLLNIGPKADGTIPAPEEAILREIGAWLQRNGEAIYGSRPWKIFGEGPTEVSEGSFTDTDRGEFTGADIRFTTQGELLYATALAWPGARLTVHALGRGAGHLDRPIQHVSLLGHDAPLPWQQTETALVVDLPSAPIGDHAFVFKIV